MIFEIINRQTDLYLTGDIGFEVSARNFIEELKKVTTPKLVVHIDSLGGSALDSISIFNALKDFKGEKVAVVEGVAMSAASYILMAFDKIIAKPNALIMLHNPLVEHCEGNAKDLSKIINTLNTLTDIYIEAYHSKTKKSKDELKSILDAETYFTANEAKNIGLIDEVETTNTTILSKEVLTQAVETRLVAYKKKYFMNTEETLKKPIEESTVVEEVIEKQPTYTVEEANAVLETAKEVNTHDAYKLALEQIMKAIEGIEDKTAYEDILIQLENLIKETEPVEESVSEVKEEIEEVIEEKKEEEIDTDKNRRNAILSFSKEINEDGTLDKLLIEALAGNMSLEDFKTESCKLLSIAKAKQSFKALLYGTSNNNVAKPILRRKSDYISYYNNLQNEGRTAEAKQFKAKYNNIF